MFMFTSILLFFFFLHSIFRNKHKTRTVKKFKNFSFGKMKCEQAERERHFRKRQIEEIQDVNNCLWTGNCFSALTIKNFYNVALTSCFFHKVFCHFFSASTSIYLGDCKIMVVYFRWYIN